MGRIRGDFKYMLMNGIINKIPSWHVRKVLYKLCGLQIGKDSRIGIGTIIIWPKKIEIGERTIINEYCHLDGRGGLKIGKDCSISIYSKLISATHSIDSNSFEYYSQPIIIGDNVWLGCSAVVLNGSVIKDKTVIGAACVFKGTSDENDVYVGNPAKLLRKRNVDISYAIDYKPHFR